MPAKRPAYKAPPIVMGYNWTGPYVGGFVGGAWAGDATTTDLGNGAGFYNFGATWALAFDASFIGGGTLGYNWQAPGSPWVIGLEGEIGYLRLTGSAPDPTQPDTTASAKVGDWYGFLGGRAGYAWDRTLLYLKGGVAFVDVQSATLDTCVAAGCAPGLINSTGSDTVVTWAVGGGFEWAWTGNWSFKAEYLFIGLDETVRNCGVGGGAAAGIFCWDTSFDGVHTAKVGLNYRFGR
jgi:outer membrane immunogenic protein